MLVFTACGASQAQQAPTAATSTTDAALAQADRAAAVITAESMRTVVAKLASDEFGGRGPATQGDELTRSYLTEQLQALGYRPGAPNDSWQQYFDLVGIKARAPQAWAFSKGEDTLTLKWWDDFIAASGVQAPMSKIENAEVVFVGYGIQAPEYRWDDFKGQDLKGKVLLMLNNDPDWDPALFKGVTRLYYGRWTYKYESAARQGAVGAIIIHTTPSAGYPYKVVQTSWSGEQFELPAENEPRVQVRGWITEDKARALAKLAGKDLDQLVNAARSRDFVPVPLGVRTSIAFANELHHVRTANVLGLLPGRDAKLKDEVVVISAHHDHLGIGEPDARGDRIYNGALDNASGVAQVFAIAKAFKALPQPPRRSVLIAFVAAEEQGLLGSQYYARHPTFPPGKIAANINYDSANKWGRTRDVPINDKGKSSLDAIAARYAHRQGREIEPNPYPDRGSFYRSDQFNFAKIGVPAIRFITGTDFIGRPPEWGKQQYLAYENTQYHQPSDELTPDWNFDGMIEDAALGFYIGLDVANAAAMPTWVPGDEFEATRKAALESVRRH
jgi:Zn-dependent M28 family amino/carboxypeptidase